MFFLRTEKHKQKETRQKKIELIWKKESERETPWWNPKNLGMQKRETHIRTDKQSAWHEFGLGNWTSVFYSLNKQDNERNHMHHWACTLRIQTEWGMWVKNTRTHTHTCIARWKFETKWQQTQLGVLLYTVRIS